MKAVKISVLQKRFIEVMGKPIDYPIKITGIRPGEKFDELLVTSEELPKIEIFEDIICIKNFELQEIEENKIINSNYNHKLDDYSSINNHFDDNEL
jgi:FlaA1/EpsC-like NDP-sugar epimerase